MKKRQELPKLQSLYSLIIKNKTDNEGTDTLETINEILLANIVISEFLHFYKI